MTLYLMKLRKKKTQNIKFTAYSKYTVPKIPRFCYSLTWFRGTSRLFENSYELRDIPVSFIRS